MKHKILYDLSMCYYKHGFSGIPQDARLLFSGLSEPSRLKLTGLIKPFGDSFYLKENLNTLKGQSIFLGPFLKEQADQQSFPEKLIKSFISGRIAKAYQTCLRNVPSSSKTTPADSNFFFDMIWRNYFSCTINPAHRHHLSTLDYHLSPIGTDKMMLRARLGLTPPRIDTSKFDFLITQDSRPLKTTKNTIKIARYHDGLPVSMSDTFLGSTPIKNHIALIKASEKDTIYVCNSNSAFKDLEKISPRAAENARIIPYFIPKMKATEKNKHALLNIVKSRISPSTLPKNKDPFDLINTWLTPNNNPTDIPCYIMSLATIEPRKNYIGLINAWLQLRQTTNKNIRLMIVGSPGWEYEKILDAMRPHIATGDLLHLEKVAQHELPYLYSSAACFAFPSFGEGFGLPPTEAMQCDCPVISSDILAHRYSTGDAAIYCDPYDITDIAAKLNAVLFPDSDQFVETMIQKGKKNVERFSTETLLPTWEALFDELKGNHKKGNTR